MWQDVDVEYLDGEDPQLDVDVELHQKDPDVQELGVHLEN